MNPLGGMFSGRHGLFTRTQYLQPAEKMAMSSFISEIKDKKQVTKEHHELKDAIDLQMEEYPDNVEDDEVELVTKFQQHWFNLHDDTTKRFRAEKIIDNLLCMSHSREDMLAEEQKYYPEKFGKNLPRKGGWVLMLKIVPVEEKYRNELFDVRYAVPIPNKKVLHDEGGKPIVVPYYKAQIQVNGQEVTIWPHEYVPYDIKEVLEGVGHQWEFVRLGGSTNYDEAKVHYLGTRGISRDKVYELLMGSIQSLDYCYYKLHPDAHEYFDFVISCLERGIRSEMIDRLWHSKVTGKPLFKVVEVKSNDKPKAKKSKDR